MSSKLKVVRKWRTVKYRKECHYQNKYWHQTRVFSSLVKMRKFIGEDNGMPYRIIKTTTINEEIVPL